MRDIPLTIGEPAPWFICRTRSNPRYAFDSVGGLYVVLCFFGSAADPVAAAVLSEIMASRARFDEVNTCFFGVSVDPEDERAGRVADSVPGIRYFWDFDRSVSARYGASRADGRSRPITYVLDPGLRVLEVLPMSGDPASHVSSLLRILDRLPALAPSCGARPSTGCGATPARSGSHASTSSTWKRPRCWRRRPRPTTSPSLAISRWRATNASSADSGHREHRDRSIVIARIGDRDRSVATLVVHLSVAESSFRLEGPFSAIR